MPTRKRSYTRLIVYLFLKIMHYFNLIEIKFIYIKQQRSRCWVRHYIDRQLYSRKFIFIFSFNMHKVDKIILALREESQTYKVLLTCWEWPGILHCATISTVVHTHEIPQIGLPDMEQEGNGNPGAVHSCGSGGHPAGTESQELSLVLNSSLVIFLVHTKKNFQLDAICFW